MLLGEETSGLKFLLVCKWLLGSISNVKKRWACSSREDGTRTKKRGNLRMLMSSAGSLTSLPKAECWLSRTENQFSWSLCWDSQKSLMEERFRTRLAVNWYCQMAEQSKYLAVKPTLCLGKGWTCIPTVDLGGFLSDNVSCLLCHLPQWVMEWLTAHLHQFAPCKDLSIGTSLFSSFLVINALFWKSSFDCVSERMALTLYCGVFWTQY